MLEPCPMERFIKNPAWVGTFDSLELEFRSASLACACRWSNDAKTLGWLGNCPSIHDDLYLVSQCKVAFIRTSNYQIRRFHIGERTENHWLKHWGTFTPLMSCKPYNHFQTWVFLLLLWQDSWILQPPWGWICCAWLMLGMTFAQFPSHRQESSIKSHVI